MTGMREIGERVEGEKGMRKREKGGGQKVRERGGGGGESL